MAAIIDDVIGTTVYSLDNENQYISVNLVIDFLESAKIGETIVGKSSIIRQGKTIINTECEVFNKSGKLLVRGSSNLLNIQRKAGS
jgi:acyl-coenzyme A thioesterase PaaI-like protein